MSTAYCLYHGTKFPQIKSNFALNFWSDIRSFGDFNARKLYRTEIL